jgi:ABC-type sugar transport system substrate-binding protein
MTHVNRDRRPMARVAVLLVVAVLLLVGAVPVAAATPTALDRNLVKNAGAELGTGTSGYTTVAIPSWATNPNFTVVRYGAPGFPTKDESGRIGGGKKFFSCGTDTAYATMSQKDHAQGSCGPDR